MCEENELPGNFFFVHAPNPEGYLFSLHVVGWVDFLRSYDPRLQAPRDLNINYKLQAIPTRQSALTS